MSYKETQTHEFSEGYVDPKLCYYCGGYPFDLQHWTV
jgi:hypothetical protein